MLNEMSEKGIKLRGLPGFPVRIGHAAAFSGLTG